MAAVLGSSLLIGVSSALLVTSGPALARREIPKAVGHDQCPLGYVNTLGQRALAGLLRSGTNQWSGLQSRLDEHRGWLLQEKKGPSNLLKTRCSWMGAEHRALSGAPSLSQLLMLVMTIEQLQRRYHWLKYEADFIADAAQASVISEQADEVMAEINRRLALEAANG